MRGSNHDPLQAESQSAYKNPTKESETPRENDLNQQYLAPTGQGHAFAHSLVTRCRALLAELDTFKALLSETQRNPQVVEVRSLRSNVVSELKTLEKLSAQLGERVTQSEGQGSERTKPGDNDKDTQDGEDDGYTEQSDAELRVIHALRSSNLPFYEAVWSIAKRTCTGLVAFGKRFYWGGEGENAKDKKKAKRKSVFVDIVADDGEEWVKVSTVSETRLLFEMAEKGWEADSERDDYEDGETRTVLQNHERDGEGSEYSDDEDDEIELLKLARDMKKAASFVRVDYRRPRLRFVMPKVKEGSCPEIDDLLKAIRGCGVVVNCGEDVTALQPSAGSEAVPAAGAIQDEVRSLLPNRFKRFTSTLNVDCTLLLAIISDLSHYKDIDPSPKHHKAINRQIEIEHERPLLSTELWPAMHSHRLVCTSEAAKRMREIVETIGTATERKRMTILMSDESVAGAESASLVAQLQELSDYQVPLQLDLPISIVDAEAAINTGKQAKLPPIAQKVEGILSDINTSVFLYGWVSDMMTITSNRTVVKQIENLIEAHRDSDDLQGPLVWVCDTARSLIGKEKGRKN